MKYKYIYEYSTGFAENKKKHNSVFSIPDKNNVYFRSNYIKRVVFSMYSTIIL